MRMWEQVDSVVYALHRYSWIFDAPYRMRKQLPGWKWVQGAGCRGSYVTNDRNLANQTAERFGIKIESNGTHNAIMAP